MSFSSALSQSQSGTDFLIRSMFWCIAECYLGGSKLLTIVAKGAVSLTYFMVADGRIL